ncbi:YihY/virulence factor BrkB family protein [Pelagibius sp. 7325]|uniref:YihY/virulence factor BrkB family protein n=1 Tax=Pelagibius sp. 7325 TaxID=3131994 RepID=UPI0030EBC35B
MSKYYAGERGEYADRPLAIPRRGWWQILKRVYGEMAEDRLSIISAGISYYCLLGVFPGIAVLIMLYGVFSDPAEVRDRLATFSDVLPADAYAMLVDQLDRIRDSAGSELGFGLLASFALATWGASRAVQALMIAMNVAYQQPERRGVIRRNLVALGLTLGGVCFFILSITAIAALPAAAAVLNLGRLVTFGLGVLQWGALCIAAIFALAVLYRVAPCRASPRFRWVTPGAIVATLLWMVSSLLFSFYVANFAHYDQTFGSIGAVVILLLWFYISAFAVCLGAEINAELEHQTYRDTTTGPTRPIGERGAYVADNVAPPPR